MRQEYAFDSAKLQAAVAAGLGEEIIRRLFSEKGIAFTESLGKQIIRAPNMSMDSMARALGMDAPAQSQTITVGNAGIPWFLANVIDPQMIKILVAPMMAAKIGGEKQMGDWLSATVMFLVAEATGDTSAYGDYSNSGSTNVNVNFPQRQNFLFQSHMLYGDR